jgi:hypothetical protein
MVRSNFHQLWDAARFVRYMVHHYKDRVHYQEIWNQPDTDTP